MRLLVFFFYLGLLPFSRLAAEQWIVPGVTNATASNGLHYATDLKLCNPGSVTASVTLDLITGSADPPAGSVPQSIAPGQTQVLTNVLQSVWGLTERSGALRITVDQQLVIAANVYTDTDPAGIYGFELDSIPYERWTTAGATVHSAWISQAADPSAGFTSTIGVVLAASGSGVDVRVFDAAGHQVGRTQVTGGPVEQRIPVSALAGVDLPAGRVEFDVTSGRALAYALVTDNITGDTMIVSGSPDTTQPLDAALTGLVKASSAAPQSASSDLRIFNLSTTQAAAITVTVLSASVDSLATRNMVVTVPAGQIQEIPDVLGQLFQAPQGAVGALHFQSAQPAIVLARTATVNTDGSPGTFGAFQSSIATADFLGATDSATFAGLRADTGGSGTVTSISLLAGADGASANLTLSGPEGSSLATATLTLGTWQSQESPLADLFAGVSVPDDSRLDVQMTAGKLSGFARAADIDSGDTWILPAAAGQPYFCPAAAIVSFAASPNALGAAGKTTLYWSVANADTVAISPSVANPPLGGSAAVSVNATTVFTITATGPCAAASQSVTVAVGAPAITSISPASGAPGQVLTLKLRNVSNPNAIAQAEIKFSASLTLAAQIRGVIPSGDVTILVPFVSDTSNPAAHLTGAVTIALDLSTGQTAAVPFNILPLTYAGKDATADLQSLTNAAVQFVKAQLNAQQAAPDFASAVPTLLTAVDRYAAVLNKLASDIAATGTASLPMIPSSAGASTSVTVTRKQLETFFALYYSMTGASSGGLPPMSIGVRPRLSRRDGTPTMCLYDDVAYETCLSLVGSDPFEPFRDFFLQLIQQSGFGQCTFSGTNATIATVASYLKRLFQLPLFSCYTKPTEIVGFKAQPTPDPIPLGVRNGGTLITATLRPLFDDFTFIVAPFGEALLALNTLPQSCQTQIYDAVVQTFKTVNNEGQEIIQNLINSGAWKISPPVDVPVYQCDVNDLTPLDPSRLARRPDWDNDATFRFGLQGLKNGAAAVHVVPNGRHFMRLTDWNTMQAYRTRYLEEDPNFDKITRVSVNVAGAKRLTVDGSLQNIGPFSPASATSPNQAVVQGADFSVPLITGNFGCPVGATGCNGAAYESHSVTQVNDTTWQIQISSGGYTQGRVSVNFVNPPNRNNTQHIVIQTNASGTDCGLYLTASARGPDGKLIGPSYNILHGDLQAYTIDAPGAVTGGVLLEIDGVTGSSCVANATIQLLDQ